MDQNVIGIIYFYLANKMLYLYSSEIIMRWCFMLFLWYFQSGFIVLLWKWLCSILSGNFSFTLPCNFTMHCKRWLIFNFSWVVCFINYNTISVEAKCADLLSYSCGINCKVDETLFWQSKVRKRLLVIFCQDIFCYVYRSFLCLFHTINRILFLKYHWKNIFNHQTTCTWDIRSIEWYQYTAFKNWADD